MTGRLWLEGMDMQPAIDDAPEPREISIGIDLGQQRDHTAIVVAEVIAEPTGHVEERPGSNGGFWRIPEKVEHFHVRHIERFDLGTQYLTVADRVGELDASLRERFPDRDRHVLCDATGLGRPAIEPIEHRLHPSTYLTRVTLTATEKLDGAAWSREVRCGKLYVSSRLSALAEQRRIHLPEGEEARLLAEELLTFEKRASESGHVRTGAFEQGAHDDMVIALGLASLFDYQLARVSFAPLPPEWR